MADRTAVARLAVGAAVSAVLVAVVVGWFALSDRGGEGDDTASTTAAATTSVEVVESAAPTTSAADEVAFDEAERDRFLDACAADQVEPSLCTCAADGIALLPTDDIRAGMDRLPGLTPAFEAVFDECV